MRAVERGAYHTLRVPRRVPPSRRLRRLRQSTEAPTMRGTSMLSPMSVAEAPSLTDRIVRGAGFALVAAYLLASLAVRLHAMQSAAGAAWASTLVPAGVALGVLLCIAKPALVERALAVFGFSFLFYGFHSYRPSSQLLELLVTAFTVVLLLRPGRKRLAPSSGSGESVVRLSLAYGLLATTSLLLLPVTVLEHRVFLEGSELGRAVLGAFPKDPLYPIASVNRLWLFSIFAGLLAAQADGPQLYRRLAHGVAVAAIASAALGLLDFAGALSLDGYNLSNLFYGREYRRLQSTFGNPSWFACFAACSLPFVWRAFENASGRARIALAAAFPLLAASLFLSGARAGWLAALVLLVVLVAARVVARRSGRALAEPDGASWFALAASGATVAVLAVAAWTTPA
ncbi:MAG TPA: hypothetical protein VIJ10_16170, partial [Vicinamibacteria bacterium]